MRDYLPDHDIANDPPDGHREAYDDLVHDWFGLSYANYLVVPRIILQSMPADWQQRFIECMDEMQETLAIDNAPSKYLVKARDFDGRFIHDPYHDYRHAPKVPSREASE